MGGQHACWNCLVASVCFQKSGSLSARSSLSEASIWMSALAFPLPSSGSSLCRNVAELKHSSSRAVIAMGRHQEGLIKQGVHGSGER